MPRPDPQACAPTAAEAVAGGDLGASRSRQVARRVTAPYVVGVLAGEGVGPEVVGAALDVLAVIAEVSPVRFEVRTGGPIGRAAVRATGRALPDEVTRFCAESFRAQGAVLCGPGEDRFVYDLRERLGLYYKLVPLRPLVGLDGVGPLKSAARAGVDVLIVRENVAGLYFGEGELRRMPDGRSEASHRFGYEDRQVDRLLRVAIALAATRARRLTVVVKRAGIPAASTLWIERMEALTQGTGLAVEILEIDNAAYQLVADPTRFDVIAAPNMFGDILADLGAVLLGSRGLSFSGNFGDDGAAVYQTGHGAAHDLAGSDRANPIGQIQALGMMLRRSFGLDAIAAALDDAIGDVVAAGARTADIMAPGCTEVGTRELGRRIAASLRVRLSTRSAM